MQPLQKNEFMLRFCIDFEQIFAYSRVLDALTELEPDSHLYSQLLLLVLRQTDARSS
jgi:hypothetical protein